jgi:hypothetical protein
VPNGQVYAVAWSVKVGFTPSMQTELLVELGSFRVTYNRQGFWALVPILADVVGLVCVSSLGLTLLPPLLKDAGVYCAPTKFKKRLSVTSTIVRQVFAEVAGCLIRNPKLAVVVPKLFYPSIATQLTFFLSILKN